jgi:hypothetical protein
MRASGLPGNRVEAYRAGIMPTIFTALLYPTAPRIARTKGGVKGEGRRQKAEGNPKSEVRRRLDLMGSQFPLIPAANHNGVVAGGETR